MFSSQDQEQGKGVNSHCPGQCNLGEEGGEAWESKQMEKGKVKLSLVPVTGYVENPKESI